LLFLLIGKAVMLGKLIQGLLPGLSELLDIKLIQAVEIFDDRDEVFPERTSRVAQVHFGRERLFVAPMRLQLGVPLVADMPADGDPQQDHEQLGETIDRVLVTSQGQTSTPLSASNVNILGSSLASETACR